MSNSVSVRSTPNGAAANAVPVDATAPLAGSPTPTPTPTYPPPRQPKGACRWYPGLRRPAARPRPG